MTTELKATAEQFKRFVREREAVRRRKEDGEPQPWTRDPILAKYHFTNVDRRDDKGTKALVHMVKGLSKPDVILNCAAWRLLCRPTTQDAVLPLSAKRYDWKRTYELLKNCASKGPVFGPAYQTCPAPTGFDTGDTLKNYARLFEHHAELWLERADEVYASENLNKAAAALSSPGLGKMMALQVAMDVSYDKRAAFHGADDLQLPVNSGARVALRAIYGREGLAAHQGRLERLAKSAGLTVVQAEHALCEFGKYVRLRDGVTHGRRTYAPPEEAP